MSTVFLALAVCTTKRVVLSTSHPAPRSKLAYPTVGDSQDSRCQWGIAQIWIFSYCKNSKFRMRIHIYPHTIFARTWFVLFESQRWGPAGPAETWDVSTLAPNLMRRRLNFGWTMGQLMPWDFDFNVSNTRGYTGYGNCKLSAVKFRSYSLSDSIELSFDIGDLLPFIFSFWIVKHWEGKEERVYLWSGATFEQMGMLGVLANFAHARHFM